MPSLLQLDSSADLTGSRSRRITAAFARAWTELSDQHTVVHRDLHTDPIPHLAEVALHHAPDRRTADSGPSEAAASLQRQLIDELLAADVVVLGAPLYNYSVPSTLKAWIDHIHIPGWTAGPDSQPLAGRPAVIVSARGAVYDEGTPTAGLDSGIPLLRTILGRALGMTTELIVTDLTLADSVPALAPHRDRATAEFAAALSAAEAAARRWGTPPSVAADGG